MYEPCPDFTGERHFLSHIYAYFDESGKYKEHPIVTFCGFVDHYERWRVFSEKWVRLLREYEITRFHAVRALGYMHPYGKMPKGTPEERAAQIAPFVSEIIDGLELGFAVSVDVQGYAKVPIIHQLYSADPHYFAFYMAINMMLVHFRIPKQLTIGLICHDEQQKAPRCYELLKRLKLRIPEVRQQITSICFMDDRDSPQLHPPDLFGYLARLEAMRIFAERPYPYQPLFNSFFGSSSSGNCMHADARFFSEDNLREYAHAASKPIGSITFASRVKLPTGD